MVSADKLSKEAESPTFQSKLGMLKVRCMKLAGEGGHWLSAMIYRKLFFLFTSLEKFHGICWFYCFLLKIRFMALSSYFH